MQIVCSIIIIYVHICALKFTQLSTQKFHLFVELLLNIRMFDETNEFQIKAN